MSRPRLTVRARLTLLYTGLFAACGAIVVAVSYTLVAQLGTPGQSQKPVPGGGVSASFAAQCRSEQLSAHPDQGILAKCASYLRRQGGSLQQQGALAQRDLTLSHLLQYSLITLAVVIALAAILGWIFAGRALRPVQLIAAAARAASEHDLSARVAATGPRDELRELAETFDEMLARLQAGFEGQQRFIANASHELRTPLAVMRATVDVVLGNPGATPGELRGMAADIRAAVDHAEHLISALLILARNERGLTVREQVDLATAAEDVLDTYAVGGRRHLGRHRHQGRPQPADRRQHRPVHQPGGHRPHLSAVSAPQRPHHPRRLRARPGHRRVHRGDPRRHRRRPSPRRRRLVGHGHHPVGRRSSGLKPRRCLAARLTAVRRRRGAVMVAAVEPSAVVDAAGSMHGFPAALTSFVGRATVVDEIADHLSQYRLVTVTGPGGAGKTRLAGEVARQVAGRFADGVWLAELAAVRDPAQVAPAVAAALGIRELPSAAAAEALAHAVARRQLLLVLDNCEHVIGAAAELCGRLLLGADDIRVLATSREPLQIAGEARYRLAPLTLPDPENPADPDQSEAVALFADRARRADATFALDATTAPTVARLVARLDGMPLAIELAAARVEALGVAQLLDRIDDRFTLLEAGDRLAAARQRSLAATVEWSYRLLDERERRVFRAVSVFPGPFTLEGAEAVAGDGAGPVVLHLVDCSLVVQPRAGLDGRSRYVMLETLRAYGAGLLAEAGEAEAVADALAGHALRVAEDALSALTAGPGEVAAARWLDAEDATMRRVLDWALEHDAPADGDASVAPRLAAALAWWWQIRGRLAGQVPLLRAAVDRATVGSGAWCDGHTWLGQAAMDSADPAGALRHFTAVRDAIGEAGPFPLLIRCLSGRSATLLGMGRIAEAADDAGRSVALARRAGHPGAEALALAVLSLVACVGGDRVGAVQMARQAERIASGRHGPVARACGHILTTVLIHVDDPTAAERTCTAALASARDTGDLWSLGNLLEKKVVLDLGAGRYADAASHLREALQIAVRTGVRRKALEDLDCGGYLCALTGLSAEAVTVWAAVAALEREGFSAPLHPDLPEGWPQRQEALRKARQALGPTQTQAAEDRGRAMSLATAAEYVLMLTAEGLERPAAAPGMEALSPRERELVTLVARGHTDAQIADLLFISVRTVSSHLDRIRGKTGCRRRADLTRLALSAGLV